MPFTERILLSSFKVMPGWTRTSRSRASISRRLSSLAVEMTTPSLRAAPVLPVPEPRTVTGIATFWLPCGVATLRIF